MGWTVSQMDQDLFLKKIIKSPRVNEKNFQYFEKIYLILQKI